MLRYHIQTIEVGSGGASAIMFNSIPQTYDDLIVEVSLRTNRAATFDDFVVLLNESNGTSRILSGSGSSVSSFTQPTILCQGAAGGNTTANTFGNSRVLVSSYASSTVQKSVSMDGISEHNSTTTSPQSIVAGLWADTSPVTSLRIRPGDGTLFSQYSSASLYGIKRGVSQITAPATGGEITQANGYWVHTFNSSGTFTPSRDLSNVEYLVIAGGGSGGASNYSANATSGGGGAGGYRSSVVGELSGRNSSAEARMNLTAGTAYAVTVGAGGTGSTSQFSNGTSGSNSVFNGITATGGGFGSSGEANTNGAAGGSGGGGAGRFSTRSGGAGTAGQGFDGGGQTTNINQGGGGGGAGGAGGPQGVGSSPSIGGLGLASSIAGPLVTRASGGRGSISDTNPDAAANSGSGGAGFNTSGTPARGGNGGSGVVIIRYLIPAS